MQFSLNRHPELPDIPTAVELGRNPEEKQVLSAIMVAAEVGSAFFTTPGVPPERLAALRAAFDATMKDPDFLRRGREDEAHRRSDGRGGVAETGRHGQRLSPEMLEKVRHAYVTGN